jgi:hypothetical protein
VSDVQAFEDAKDRGSGVEVSSEFPSQGKPCLPCCPWRRRAWFPIKMVIGMALSQVLVGSVILLGWTYRLMQRAVLKRWWQLSSPLERGPSFMEFAIGGTHAKQHVAWPNFILGQNGIPRDELRRSTGGFARLRIFFSHLTRSLVQNIRLGLQGILTTWSLTLPGCLLWLFAWYDGWNNSFNKGYEQAVVGPLVFILGVVLFVAAMLYVPMAQSRFASTGSWRSFFQFRMVWKIVRQEWLGCLFLAGLYALFAFPVNILKTFPQFFPQIRPELELLSAEDAISFLKIYFFWGMLFVLPVLIGLRLVAARIYASGIVRGLRRGTISEEDLSENEWEALHRLRLIEAPELATHHIIVKMLAWIATRAGRITSAILIGTFWSLFVFQILISEFFNFHPFVGWLNQPLVQLPWFRYLPGI